MDNENHQEEPRRHTLLVIGLCTFVVCPFFCFLDFLTMNLLSSVVIAFGCFGLYALVHWFIWGWAVSATTPIERAELDDTDFRRED